MDPLVSVNVDARRAFALELKSGACGAVRRDAKVLTM